jgi:cilia- and flagella-associated protein 206
MAFVLRTDCPRIDTLRMQVTFESAYARELRTLRQSRRKREKDTRRTVQHVVKIGSDLQGKDQVAELYRSVFKMLIVNSATNKVTRAVEREIAAALESVFPQTGLNAFNLASVVDKTKQMSDMIGLVQGIRLFNKCIHRGGAGFDDVPAIAETKMTQLLKELQTQAQSISDVCKRYSKTINLEFEKPGTITSPLERLQEELTNRRQYLLLVYQLQYETNEAVQNLKKQHAQFRSEASALTSYVGDNSSVPKEQVYVSTAPPQLSLSLSTSPVHPPVLFSSCSHLSFYLLYFVPTPKQPKFHSLARCWRVMMDENDLATLRAHVWKDLQEFHETYTPSISMHDLALAEKHAAATAESKSAAASNQMQIESDLTFVTTLTGHESQKELDQMMENGIVRLTAKSTPNFMSIPLEFQGYCAWSIVRRGGFLIPGRPALGILRYANRYYSFSSIEAIRAFHDDPDRYVQGVLERARAQPELIHLLCLQDEIPNSSINSLLGGAMGFLSSGATAAPIKVDQGGQTPLHFVESHIEKDYEWNEWELRRKAIQLTNLINKRTHSTQTDKSHSRRDNSTQNYLKPMNDDGTMPGVGTQTGITKGTNTERTSRYISGLRGATDQQVKVVTLTFEPAVQDATNKTS